MMMSAQCKDRTRERPSSMRCMRAVESRRGLSPISCGAVSPLRHTTYTAVDSMQHHPLPTMELDRGRDSV